MADVVYGAEVAFSMSDDQGKSIGAEQMMEVTRCTWDYQPQTKTRWPAGAKQPKIHALGGHTEVTLEGNMVGVGFSPIIDAQRAKIDKGEVPPKIKLSISRQSGDLIESWTGGVISRGGGSLSGGDNEVTTSITILFDSNASWEKAQVRGA